MARKTLFYGTMLIGTYLALAYATEGGRLLTSAAGATSTVVKTFQGRG